MLNVRRWLMFSIRDVLWLTVVVALSICLYQTSAALRSASAERDTAVQQRRRAAIDSQMLQEKFMDKQRELSQLRGQLERSQARR